MAKLHDREATRFQHNIWYKLHNFPHLTKNDWLVYLYLCHNREVERSGIYLLDEDTAFVALKITQFELQQSMHGIGNSGLLFYDRNLLYVPFLSVEQEFGQEQDRYWIQKVKNALKFVNYPSSRGSPHPNLAFDKWRSDHQEIISAYYQKEDERKKKSQ